MTEAYAEAEAAAADIRFGKIVFTNVWPVFFGFPSPRMARRIRMITRTPTLLNEALTNGDVDVASISSFAYAKHADRLVLLPNLSVSAKGSVGSLLLFAKRPLGERLPERIALASTSATSVQLLKIIMARRFEHQAAYVDMPPDLETMMSACDAALLIGDDAIRASWSAEARRYYVADLCTLWTEWTGLGMTFAVWAMREAWLRSRGDDAAAIYEALMSSKREGTTLPDALLAEAARTIGGTVPFWRAYFRQIDYDFGEEHRQGLELYFRYAHELGFLETVPSLRLWQYPNGNSR